MTLARAIRALPISWPSNKPPLPTEWIVDGWIPKIGAGILAAPSAAGKTYLALDLALNFAIVGSWAGQRVVEKCATLYFPVERPRQFERRLHFGARARGLKPAQLPIGWCKICPPLTEDKAAEVLIATAEDAMQTLCDVRLGLIVIDTLIVAAAWDNEDNSAEIQVVWKALRHVAEVTKTFVLAIDHTGHSARNRSRGSSDKESSADVMLVLGEGLAKSIKLKKNTDGQQGMKVDFRLKMHHFDNGTTERTVEWAGARSGALAAAIKATGVQTVNHRRAARVSAVRKQFDAINKRKSPAARRKAWARDQRGYRQFEHHGVAYFDVADAVA